MGDTSEGSSNAAQRALEEKTITKSGFFERLMGLGGPSSDDEKNQDNRSRQPSNGHVLTPLGGLGNLSNVTVAEVATPKADIVSVSVGTGLDDLVKVFRESGLTRLPVFRETLDNPLGFVHLKDLALKHGFNGDGERLNLRRMARPLLFAPPSMPIGVLLQKMQVERIHMALVIDEYGGVDGLVTIEDLIEQVVGEIADEHDIDDDQFWTLEEPGVYICQSRTPLDELETEFGISLLEIDEEEVDTLGGLIFLISGRVPVRGEVIRHTKGLEFEIVDADLRRIKRVRVRLPAALDS